MLAERINFIAIPLTKKKKKGKERKKKKNALKSLASLKEIAISSEGRH